MALKDYITALNRAIIFRFCLKCGQFLGLRSGRGITGISHGLCPRCLKEIKELKKK